MRRERLLVVNLDGPGERMLLRRLSGKWHPRAVHLTSTRASSPCHPGRASPGATAGGAVATSLSGLVVACVRGGSGTFGRFIVVVCVIFVHDRY